jgi:FlaA1/EpsC-like NDP-sugar epimerase
MRRIVKVCRSTDVEVMTLPGVYELIAGDVEIQRFRPVQV